MGHSEWVRCRSSRSIYVHSGNFQAIVLRRSTLRQNSAAKACPMIYLWLYFAPCSPNMRISALGRANWIGDIGVIQVITSDNQHLYAKQLDQMFRMRHEYYVLGHGWDGLTSRDGRETDEFDNLEAVYLVSVDVFGDVAASLRLNPTTGPTLLKKLSQYADEPPPESPTCWDLSRWIARPDQRRADKPRWPSNHQRELTVAVLEFCQSRGADRLTMLCETRLAERIGAYGWPVRYLGQPREYEGGKGSAVAALIEVGDHLLTMTRAKTGVLQPVLFELQPENRPAGAKTTPDQVASLVQSIGPENLRALVGHLATALGHGVSSTEGGAGDRAGKLAMLGAFNRMLESAGAGLELPGNALATSTKPSSQMEAEPGRASPSGN